ncbi:MAG: TPM domain-containing protein [Firmicutes bacterium]|nr:TPM domain-containing protein [Bacillota bacterium]
MTRNKISILLLLLICVLILPRQVRAEETPLTVNPETGYGVYIMDNADLLTDSEEAELVRDMYDITAYGNVLFLSHKEANSDSDAYASNFYHNMFGTESGMMFMIDMYLRNITIFSDGAVYRTIDRQYALTIVDNVYTYASKGDYYNCARNGFIQSINLLQNGYLMQPMKIVCTALLSLILGLLINFIALRSNRSNLEKGRETTKPIMVAQCVSKRLLRTHYISTSSGGGGYSGGGGGGGYSGGGGGGGGGGGSSGGGGSHGF